MADKVSLNESEFEFDAAWPNESASGGVRVLDSSVGRLTIAAKDTVLTAFQSDKGDGGDALTLPLYNVAEWIASNWWSLLYEPRKTDRAEQDDPNNFGFRSRHWLGMARDGFALPDLWFLPAGDSIELLGAADTYLRFARITFLHGISDTMPLDTVRNELHSFVQKVVNRVSDEGVRESDLHALWAQVCATTPDQEAYCRLVGSLGLSPYDDHPEIDARLEKSAAELSNSILSDLCQASDESSFKSVAVLTKSIVDALPAASSIDIRPLADIEIPADQKAEAWRWGKDAARTVRAALSISSNDPHGAESFFEKLKLDASGRVTPPNLKDAITVSGGFEKHDNEMHLVLAEQATPQRRFAASRAAFLACSNASLRSRLITGARTRDQTASRAFAAELLAPIDYVRRRAGASKTLSTFQINDLSSELNVSPWVVRYQAQNNRLFIFEN